MSKRIYLSANLRISMMIFYLDRQPKTSLVVDTYTYIYISFQVRNPALAL